MINVNVGGPIQAECRYKTKVLKGNLSFESQVTDVNTKYIVKWDFSLNQDITMPEHCIIEFDGGSINGNGHKIYGVDTVMIYNQMLSEILFDVSLEGTWIHKNGGHYTDNEDITAINGSILKFANKTYDAAAFSGLGRKYLRKNIVDVYDDNIWAVKIINGVVYVLYVWRNVWYVPYNYNNGKGIILRNTVVEEIDGYNVEYVKTLFPDVQYLEYTNEGSIVITLPNGSSITQSALDATTKYPFDSITTTKSNILNQEEINEPNTIYIIQYDYDLYDKTIIVPENSVLLFNGGSLVGGDLNLNGAKILPNYNEVVKSTLNIIGNPAVGTMFTSDNGVLSVYDGVEFAKLALESVITTEPGTGEDSLQQRSTGAEATGQGACAFGSNTTAEGAKSHAEGNWTFARGFSAHAEGNRTVADDTAHAEGYQTVASGQFSHAEGEATDATHKAAHAEGGNTKAIQERAHAEGDSTEASGYNSHAEGDHTVASGNNSHAEGRETSAEGNKSHAEGYNTHAIGENSHAEGYATHAIGENSHAEGYATHAIGTYSHAGGNGSEARVNYSFAHGFRVLAVSRDSETAFGRYNKSNVATLFSIGFGDSDSNRKNAFEIMNNDGRLFVFGLGGYDGTNPDSALSVQDLLTYKVTGIKLTDNVTYDQSTLIAHGATTFGNCNGATLYLNKDTVVTNVLIYYDHDNNKVRNAAFAQNGNEIVVTTDNWGFFVQKIVVVSTYGNAELLFTF